MANGNNQNGQAWNQDFVPLHPNNHENRTGIGFSPKAFEHTASRGNITAQNAYDMKTAVSASTPTYSYPIQAHPDAMYRNYEVNLQGQPYTVRTSDVSGSERIGTAFPGTSNRAPRRQ